MLFLVVVCLVCGCFATVERLAGKIVSDVPSRMLNYSTNVLELLKYMDANGIVDMWWGLGRNAPMKLSALNPFQHFYLSLCFTVTVFPRCISCTVKCLNTRNGIISPIFVV